MTGTVSEIFVSRQNTNVYLYLDGSLPKVQFAAVWPGTNDPPITGLQDLIAKSISVSGRIITDQGTPVIIVSSWEQIEQQ